MLGSGGVVMSPGGRVVMSSEGWGGDVTWWGGGGDVTWGPRCNSLGSVQGRPPGKRLRELGPALSAAWPGLLVGAGLGLLTLALCDPA